MSHIPVSNNVVTVTHLTFLFSADAVTNLMLSSLPSGWWQHWREETRYDNTGVWTEHEEGIHMSHLYRYYVMLSIYILHACFQILYLGKLIPS
jgi:hypothetical protein